MTAADDAEPSIPGFQVLGRIGRGASATVWAARDRDSGRMRALKVSRRRGPERLADASAARFLVREAALLRRLRHPHLVGLHQVLDLADGRRVLVLDLAEVGSLADLVDARGTLSPGEVCWLLAPIAQALAYLHGAGVVHGDVSPANILLATGGHPMLGDLGVSGDVGVSAYGDGGPPVAHRTPGFAAPEVLVAGRAGPAADVWALGAVLGRVSAGRGVLDGLIARCTADDEAVRPTAAQVERALRLTVTPVPLYPAPAPRSDRAVTRPVEPVGLR